jgi:hypothetical protein
MARDRRALRMVVNAWVGLSLLVGSLPIAGAQAAGADLARQSADPPTSASARSASLAPPSPPVAWDTPTGAEQRFEEAVAKWPQVARTGDDAHRAAEKADTPDADAVSSVPNYIPRALPLSFGATGRPFTGNLPTPVDVSRMGGFDTLAARPSIIEPMLAAQPAWQATLTPTLTATPPVTPSVEAPPLDPPPPQAAAPRVEISLEEQRLAPAELSLAPGIEVRWTNRTGQTLHLEGMGPTVLGAGHRLFLPLGPGGA